MKTIFKVEFRQQKDAVKTQSNVLYFVRFYVKTIVYELNKILSNTKLQNYLLTYGKSGS